MRETEQHGGSAISRQRGNPGWTSRAAAWLASILIKGTGRMLRQVAPSRRYAAVDALTALLAPLILRANPRIARNFSWVLGATSPGAQARVLARASIGNFGRMAIDFLVASVLAPAEVLEWVEAVHVERFAAAQARGRGVILALPHLGSWDVAASFATAYGLRLTVVTRDDWMAAVVEAVRRKSGVGIVREGGSARPLFQALRAGDCLAILCDVEQTQGGALSVPFFGALAPFPRGPARLAVSTGAAIVVISCTRQDRSRYCLEVRPPLVPDTTAPRDQEIVRLTTALAEEFEACIRACPTQWYPFHTIWPDLQDLQRS